MRHKITWTPRVGLIDFRSRWEDSPRGSWTYHKHASGVDMQAGKLAFKRDADADAELVHYRIDGGEWRELGVIDDDIGVLKLS